MSILSSYARAASSLEKARAIPLLLLRLILAYGFYTPAKMKWSGIQSIAEWFGSMHFPLPTLSAYLAATTEAAGVVLLTLGLATRLITIPLMIIMLVAIFAVHWPNGFSAGENGFEIPLYYLLMLFTLFILGPGSVSVDEWVRRKYRN